jgi:hypothetical protein
MFKKRRKAIMSLFENSEIILGPSSANSFGQESLGVKQVRGNGLLILTEHELFFGMYVPRKDWHIPLKTITIIEIVRSHLYKTKSRDLLKVVFTNKFGKIDSIAWLVGNLEIWIKTLNRLIELS